MKSRDVRIVPAGDAAVLVQFDERIDPEINQRAIATANEIRLWDQPGIRDVVPTYRSVAIYFDPLLTDYDKLFGRLGALASAPPPPAEGASRTVRIPVKYGGEYGPDLAEVARFAGTTVDEVVALHTSKAYRVFMLGFVPGFAYMGTVDARIAMPRRASPRTKVPAGSVGIAAAQTGVYPSDMPGGWQIIGRTSERPFDVTRQEPSLFTAGDTVQFYPTDSL